MPSGTTILTAVYKKLGRTPRYGDVTELLKELHKIVNEAIRAQPPGDDQTAIKAIRHQSDRLSEAPERSLPKK